MRGILLLQRTTSAKGMAIRSMLGGNPRMLSTGSTTLAIDSTRLHHKVVPLQWPMRRKILRAPCSHLQPRYLCTNEHHPRRLKSRASVAGRLLHHLLFLCQVNQEHEYDCSMLVTLVAVIKSISLRRTAGPQHFPTFMSFERFASSSLIHLEISSEAHVEQP